MSFYVNSFAIGFWSINLSCSFVWCVVVFFSFSLYSIFTFFVLLKMGNKNHSFKLALILYSTYYEVKNCWNHTKAKKRILNLFLLLLKGDEGNDFTWMRQSKLEKVLKPQELFKYAFSSRNGYFSNIYIDKKIKIKYLVV